MQITELAAQVQALGLSDKEAKVYVASLFLGPAAVQKIAEQAGVNRATAYVILEQLGGLGLVAQSTEKNKTVFVAEPPETLQRLFDQQIEVVERRRKELNQLLPTLQQMERSDRGVAPIVRFYKGREGVMTMIREVQRKGRPNSVGYSLVNLDEVEKISPEIVSAKPGARVKKKMSSKILYSYRKAVPDNPALLREMVRVDEPIKADIALFEDTATFSTYAGPDTIGVIIESKEIVGALRQLFERAWGNNPK